jgi:hypothetical protein
MIRTRGRSSVVAMALFACLALLPAAARATSVEKAGDRDDILISDNAGVTDQLVVSGLFDEAVIVTSTNGTPITAEGDCAQTSPTVVTCPGVRQLSANLGGGDDSIVEDAGNVDTEFNGEAGNDTLTGGANDNVLGGGPGDDNLNGNNGRDTLEGGPGSDTESGGAGDDRLGGADGTRAPLDTGADSFDGGLGADLLFTADGQNDRFITCSPQQDAAFDFAGVDLLDLRVRNCDLIQRAAKDQHPTVQLRARTVRVRGGRASVQLQCPRSAPGGRCDGTAEIVKSGRVIARGSYRLRRGQTRTVRLRLRRRASGRAELHTAERDTQGRPETTSSRIRLVR